MLFVDPIRDAGVAIGVEDVLPGVFLERQGLTDFLGDSRIRALGDAWQHMLANVAAVVIELINLVLRWGHPEAALPSPGVYLSGAAVLLLAFSGWKGGNLVFRHRVGVAGAGDIPG